MDQGEVFVADEQEGELDPNDAWLMRAAGGEEEVDANDFPVGAAPVAQDDDQLSFEDSERFEEDSLCSWMSDAESLNQNWRGWSTARNPTSQSGIEQTFGDGSGPLLSNSLLRFTGGITSPSQSRRHPAPIATATTNAASPASVATFSASITTYRVRSLAEIAARVAARCFSFIMLEACYHAISVERRRINLRSGVKDRSVIIENAFAEHAAIPDKFFLSIVRWCFPESEEDVRLYSCLANGNADEFDRGEYLYQANAVHDVFQIGYHISAVVNATGASSIVTPTSSSAPPCRSKMTFNVSVRVDRCRIVSCSCSCAFKASWCQHVVAVCLYRINRVSEVEYRVTIWDSINELTNEELKKLAQFLINDLPRQYLPVAQRLIDQLRNPNSEINAAVGAPDPTDGGHDNVAIWCLDQRTLHENIRRILIKFCLPSPTVHWSVNNLTCFCSDVQYLSSNQPPAASEWLSLFRPHRAKEPEGLWNLLSIVREMFKRRDENATSLLHIITEECLACSQVLIWWYQTALSQSGQWTLCPPSTNKSSSLMSNQKAPQLNCASLCDEIVQLWRLAALNPRLSSFEREQLTSFIQIYHRNAVERIWKYICFLANPEASVSSHATNFVMSVVDRQGQRLSAENARFTADLFPGFLSALRACQISWNNTSIDGVLFGSNNCRSSDFSPDLKCSPNIPVLQRPLRVSEDTTLLDISTSFYRTSVYATGTNYFALHQQASRKRRKKSSRISGRRGHQFEFHDERSLIRAVRAAACAAREVVLGEEIEEDSAESGQESEAGPSATRSTNRLNGSADRNESNTAFSSANYPKSDVDELFAIAHVQQSNWDIKFARCEALISHGYAHQACVMAIELAEEMLRRPPNLLHHSVEQRYYPELSATQRHRRRRFSQSSSVPASILEAPVFELDEQLIEKSQLAENMYTSDFVKETELVSLLRRIEIGTPELQIIRDRARKFVQNANLLSSIPQPYVLPISLGHYILDSLSFSHNACQGRRTTTGIVTKSGVQRRPCDEELAIKVALEALGMKLVVSEADYPMLCESTRLQRGDLALTMLLRYKDNNDKLALVLDKLLDPTMHRMYKDHQSNAAFFLEQDPLYRKYFTGQRPHFLFKDEFHYTEFSENSNGLSGTETNTMSAENIHDKRTVPVTSGSARDEAEQLVSSFMRLSHDSPDDSSSVTSTSRRRSSDESNDSPYDESSSSGLSRCFARDAHESHSASVGTSDSPSPSRRLSNKLTVDGPSEFPSSPASHSVEMNSLFYRHNRRKPIPSLPNQASEGQAHCMMELAKRLLLEAGGSQSTVIFNASQGSQNNPQRNGPHRQLHICSFLIGLYALGLNNLLSASWQTRTYSTNVSWIHGQAIEIGCAAIKIVERVWEAHLTPTEVAALADKASQSRDPCMVEAAAKLALSVLPKAYALTAAESQKALHQCKEQSSEMLEKACRAVEQAAEKDGVYPEVLFKVARHWFDLFVDSESVSSPQNSFQSTISPQQSSYPSLQSQAHENVYPTTTPQAVQLPMQCRPVPYATASYHFMPPHHHLHQSGPHRPPLYMPPISCTQPQGIHYAQRGTLPVGAMSVINTIYPPPVVGATPSRALHISHSAPNLSPMQAVQISRRNQPLTVLQQPLCLGSGAARCQFPTVGEQCTQPIPINGTLRHHLPPPTSLMLCQSASQPVTYFGQTAPQVCSEGEEQLQIREICLDEPPMNVPLPSPSASVVGDPRMAKLVHAHRVGMIAMETMGNRNLDDNRSYAKFSQNPAYAEDVRWLFTVATRLGGVFTQSFCEVAARSIASPFVLFSLAVESAKVFHWQMPAISYHSQTVIHPVRPQLPGGAPNVRTLLLQNGFAPPTADLMQHCVEMFYAASSSKLSHPRFVPSDVEEVVQLVKTAKEAFHWIPGPGKLMFDDFMRHVRKQKACKKDVAQRINACVQNTN
uniref:SWIM-type domain-containing protein n=1 Tax=Setaria digitata TaxID=48799 RepID=A0A915PV92_9BILA